MQMFPLVLTFSLPFAGPPGVRVLLRGNDLQRRGSHQSHQRRVLPESNSARIGAVPDDPTLEDPGPSSRAVWTVHIVTLRQPGTWQGFSSGAGAIRRTETNLPLIWYGSVSQANAKDDGEFIKT